MNQQLSSENDAVKEITFAELTALVKKELQSDPNSECMALSKTYGISESTMRKLIDTVKVELKRS